MSRRFGTGAGSPWGCRGAQAGVSVPWACSKACCWRRPNAPFTAHGRNGGSTPWPFGAWRGVAWRGGVVALPAPCLQRARPGARGWMAFAVDERPNTDWLHGSAGCCSRCTRPKRPPFGTDSSWRRRSTPHRTLSKFVFATRQRAVCVRCVLCVCGALCVCVFVCT